MVQAGSVLERLSPVSSAAHSGVAKLVFRVWNDRAEYRVREFVLRRPIDREALSGSLGHHSLPYGDFVRDGYAAHLAARGLDQANL